MIIALSLFPPGFPSFLASLPFGAAFGRRSMLVAGNGTAQIVLPARDLLAFLGCQAAATGLPVGLNLTVYVAFAAFQIAGLIRG